jgi:NAD(P)-dependent dehydrogenase (short-subunit alcohol dehydrogenase family)
MAEALALQGAEVTLVGRDAERLAAAERSVAEHAQQGGALPPRSILADLATEHGVESCVSALLARDLPIDVLMNNAGAIFPVRSLTADGLERTFALNHVAPFRLTLGVTTLLRRAPAARVITVASEAHRAVLHPVEDWQSERRYTPMGSYGRSKLANILFTRALAARHAGSTITANCFHPGVVRTEWSSGTRGPLRLFFVLARPFMRSTAQGASTGVYLATSPDVADVTGRYFARSSPRMPSVLGRDDALAERLWSTTAHLTGRDLPIPTHS